MFPHVVRVRCPCIVDGLHATLIIIIIHHTHAALATSQTVCASLAYYAGYTLHSLRITCYTGYMPLLFAHPLHTRPVTSCTGYPLHTYLISYLAHCISIAYMLH